MVIKRILVVMKHLHILTVVVVTKIYTCDETAQNETHVHTHMHVKLAKSK